MNVLDIIFGVILLLFLLNGIRKGLVSSLIHLLGLVLAVVLISKTGHLVKAGLMDKFNMSEILAVIIAYVLIFLVIMIITRIAIKLVNRMVQFLNLMWLNRLLGGIFSLFCGVLIIAILIILANISPFEKEIREFTSASYIISTIRTTTEKLESRYQKIEEIKKPIKDTITDTIEKEQEKLENLID
ncbi:MAG: CvpA family protein [Candidatus Cloacimonetes bacterium]|nr:CvpA family protein [Candidatus Cloacimonadota bacterium]